MDAIYFFSKSKSLLLLLWPRQVWQKCPISSDKGGNFCPFWQVFGQQFSCRTSSRTWFIDQPSTTVCHSYWLVSEYWCYIAAKCFSTKSYPERVLPVSQANNQHLSFPNSSSAFCCISIQIYLLWYFNSHNFYLIDFALQYTMGQFNLRQDSTWVGELGQLDISVRHFETSVLYGGSIIVFQEYQR